jgi:Tfp pilus assembly protein PilF
MADIYRYRLPGQEAMYETTMLEALQKFPNNPNLVGPLALYYKQTSQTQKAIEYYEKLVKISPENQMAKEDLAELKQIKN